jgi:predicted CXXCH cytochrome family protein
VQFPNEETPRAFTLDDVKYVIGTGRYVQRYLYEVENNVYRVLPAEWNVAQQSWQPFTLAENWDAPQYDWGQNCAYCHTTGLNLERGRWEDEGVQCESCHGPGSQHQELADDAGRRPSDEELIAIRGALANVNDPQICGQCHSQGSSGANPFPTGYFPNNPLVAEGVFALSAAGDPVHWWTNQHGKSANMQYNEWLTSSHPQALSNLQNVEGEIAADCLTCHSADYAYTERLRAAVTEGEREGAVPDALTATTAQYGVTCTSCHNPHIEGNPNGFSLIAEPDALCTSCHSDADASDGLHSPTQQMFEGALFVPNVAAEPSAHFSAVEGPRCATCHLPEVPVESATRASHAFAPVLPEQALGQTTLQDSCIECHAEQVNPEQMQALIDVIQTDTQARVERARAAITASTPTWVITALDAVSGDGSWGVHNYAYTDALLDAVDVELGLLNGGGQE